MKYKLNLTKQQFADWIANLRSGNYEQGKKRLRVRNKAGDTSYCCLGVLCETLGFVPTSSEWYSLNKGLPEVEVFTYGHDDGDNASILPFELDQMGANIQGHLIRMNDQYSRTFTEIADYLETECEAVL